MDQTDRRYCPFCGHALARKAAGGQFRLVCLSCGKISYENPTTGVAGILFILTGREFFWAAAKRGKSGEDSGAFPADMWNIMRISGRP